MRELVTMETSSDDGYDREDGRHERRDRERSLEPDRFTDGTRDGHGQRHQGEAHEEVEARHAP